MAPGNWGLITMWYDKYPGVPDRGSPLEAAFVYISVQRQWSTLLATRALVQSTLPEGKEASDPAMKAFQAYCDAMMPQLADKKPVKSEAHERLAQFVKSAVSIDLRPIWAATMAAANQKVRAQRRSVRRPIGVS